MATERSAQQSRLPRERRVSRMIGSWPAGIRFEDADVPWEPRLAPGAGPMPHVWPESSLNAAARIVRR